jgi:hypothetical protein
MEVLKDPLVSQGLGTPFPLAHRYWGRSSVRQRRRNFISAGCGDLLYCHCSVLPCSYVKSSGSLTGTDFRTACFLPTWLVQVERQSKQTNPESNY